MLDRATLVEGVELANIPTLLAVLCHLTGEERWTAEPFRPAPARGLNDNDTGGLPNPVQRQVRDAAVDAITDAMESGAAMTPRDLGPEALVKILATSMAEPIPPEYGPMIRSDLAAVLDGDGPRTTPVRARRRRRAVIIGAGVSGIAAAVVLGRAGIDCTVVERNENLGGTWEENRYPGAGVDTPSHLYEYSFCPHDWPEYFSAQTDVHAYLELVADRFDVRPRIRFGCEVQQARFDEAARSWTVGIEDCDGRADLVVDFVISAVGAFNQPKFPPIEGIDAFRGPRFHTARWPKIDLRGKRVAIVGNGASAMQVVPAIAEDVKCLTIFQRSPHWIAPFDKLHTPVPDPVRALLRRVPLYHAWYRQRLGWTFNDRLHATLRRDPDWPHPERSLNTANDRHRAYFTAYIEHQLEGRPDLIDAVLPTYPPYGKRILLDNGWYRSLTRANVRLVTSPVTRLDTASVHTTDGESHAADVVVFATGFTVASFLSTLDVVGRAARPLHDVWDGDDARAFLGLGVPGFPNFFILYGPNTQPGHGGSLISAVEAQLHYVVSAIRAATAAGNDLVEIREDVYDAYNAEVDRAHEQMVWCHPGMDTYYRNSRGRVVVNTPFRVVDFWTMARQDPSCHLTAGAAR